MELALPLLALGGFYVISNQQEGGSASSSSSKKIRFSLTTQPKM